MVENIWKYSWKWRYFGGKNFKLKISSDTVENHMIFAKWMSIKILLQVQVEVSLSVIVDVDKFTINTAKNFKWHSWKSYDFCEVNVD